VGWPKPAENKSCDRLPFFLEEVVALLLEISFKLPLVITE
jgi:hypothetical protein